MLLKFYFTKYFGRDVIEKFYKNFHGIIFICSTYEKLLFTENIKRNVTEKHTHTEHTDQIQDNNPNQKVHFLTCAFFSFLYNVKIS